MRHSNNNSPPRTRSTLTQKQQRLLDCIRQLHLDYRRDSDTQDLFAALLDKLLSLTDSPYGAGGEVLLDVKGEPYFKTRAVIYPTDAAPDELDPLFKKVIGRGRALVAENPKTSRSGADRGFPQAFLGLPIYSGKTLIGAAIMANRPGGYDKKTAEFVQPLLYSFASLLQAHHSEQQLKRAAQELQREIKGRERIETTLEEIATAVSANTGVEYFVSLVQQLSTILHVDAAFISIPSATDPGIADVLAFIDRGEMQDADHYVLAATPCEKIIKEGAQYCPSGLQEEFPHSAITIGYGWDSYLGVPLRDISGNIFGLVSVADRKPIPHRQPAEAILRICAARISAELAHQRAEEKMYKLSQALEQTADSVAITDSPVR